MGGWGPFLPSLSLHCLLCDMDRGGVSGPPGPLFPCRRPRVPGDVGRQGWCSPFSELKALHSQCSWPLLPPSSSSPMISAGNGAPGNSCGLTFSPSFLLLQVHPASQGVGEGHVSPSLGCSLNSYADDPLGILGNEAPSLRGRSQMPWSPSWMDPQRPSQAHLSCWGD